MKLLWLGYLVYSLGNCVMKLCIETDLTACFSSLSSLLSSTSAFSQLTAHYNTCSKEHSKTYRRIVIETFRFTCYRGLDFSDAHKELSALTSPPQGS